MTDKEPFIEELLEAMIADNEGITFRAVCRRSEGAFKFVTDITRYDILRGRVEDAAERQKTIRRAVDRSSNKSRKELEELVATKNTEIDQLKADKELLVASHRAMFLSLAQMGGVAIWKRFFDKYESVLNGLEKMRSLPSAEIIALLSRKKT